MSIRQDVVPPLRLSPKILCESGCAGRAWRRAGGPAALGVVARDDVGRFDEGPVTGHKGQKSKRLMILLALHVSQW